MGNLNTPPTDSTTASTKGPLCVDLDGTLVATDTMGESFLGLLKTAPWKLFALLAALMTGRPKFKRHLARTAPVDPGTLPYRDEVLDEIRRARQDGRRVLLVTASDQATADLVAGHLGLFDEAIGSDGESNLKADLDLRVTSGVGYGRQFAEGEHWTVSAEIGGGWFYEDHGGVVPDDLGRARLGYHWRWQGDSPLSLEQRGEFYPSLQNADDLHSRLVSQLRYDVGQTLFGQGEWRHEWVNTPAEDRSRTDQYLMLTLGLKF